jgi:hypothetical protein
VRRQDLFSWQQGFSAFKCGSRLWRSSCPEAPPPRRSGCRASLSISRICGKRDGSLARARDQCYKNLQISLSPFFTRHF